MRSKGHRVPPTSTAKIRKLAQKLRAVFSEITDDNRLKVDILAIYEFVLPSIFPDFNLEVVPDSELGDDHGQTFPDKNIIRIKETTYNGAMQGRGRDIFTLAHELGHLFLHKNISSYARTSIQRKQATHKSYEDSEWQADTFAGEFLMPIDEVANCINAREVQYKFGVSMSAAEVRFNRVKEERGRSTM